MTSDDLLVIVAEGAHWAGKTLKERYEPLWCLMINAITLLLQSAERDGEQSGEIVAHVSRTMAEILEASRTRCFGAQPDLSDPGLVDLDTYQIGEHQVHVYQDSSLAPGTISIRTDCRRARIDVHNVNDLTLAN